MKRVAVIAAFVLLVLAALGGGAYLVSRGESAGARKPVVAKLSDPEPEVTRGNAGPLSGHTETTDRPDETTDNQPDTHTPDTTTPETGDAASKTSDRNDPRRTPERDEGSNPTRDTRNPDRESDTAKAETEPFDGTVTLTGRVSDDAGNPIARAAIMLVYDAPQGGTDLRGRDGGLIRFLSVAATDNEGHYDAEVKLTFPGEESPVTVTLHAQTAEGLRSDQQSQQLRSGESYNIDFAMPAGAEFTGRVVNHRFEPIPHASVHMQRYDGKIVDKALRVRADEDGNFSVSGLRDGTYRVHGIAEGYQPETADYSIEFAGGAIQEDVRMKPVTAVKLTLTSPGVPVSGGFNVTFYNADGKATKVAGRADREGHALVPMPENTIELEVEVQGYVKSDRVAVSPIRDDHVDIGEVLLTSASEDEG